MNVLDCGSLYHVSSVDVGLSCASPTESSPPSSSSQSSSLLSTEQLMLGQKLLQEEEQQSKHRQAVFQAILPLIEQEEEFKISVTERLIEANAKACEWMADEKVDEELQDREQEDDVDHLQDDSTVKNDYGWIMLQTNQKLSRWLLQQVDTNNTRMERILYLWKNHIMENESQGNLDEDSAQIEQEIATLAREMSVTRKDSNQWIQWLLSSLDKLLQSSHDDDAIVDLLDLESQIEQMILAPSSTDTDGDDEENEGEENKEEMNTLNNDQTSAKDNKEMEQENNGLETGSARYMDVSHDTLELG